MTTKGRRRLKAICPKDGCDTVLRIRKDGKVFRHPANEWCDGEPAIPTSTFEVGR